MQYTSVIDEPVFEADQDWLGMIRQYFTFARKLKPKIKQKAPKEITNLNQVKLVFNILRGSNVPIRLKYYKDAIKLNENVHKDLDGNRYQIKSSKIEKKLEEFYYRE
jgi:hypothetical protein